MSYNNIRSFAAYSKSLLSSNHLFNGQFDRQEIEYQEVRSVGHLQNPLVTFRSGIFQSLDPLNETNRFLISLQIDESFYI